ncbi:MAG: hypothetical protein M3Q07_15305 [Pseudobdellovibrionaceae bacterium]|nr:hypothetical protein [Pseudobdellovibrionaceae bacterium]
MRIFYRSIVPSLFFISQHLQGEVLLDASNICPTQQFGLYYGCARLPEEKLISFQPTKVTEPKVEFLNSTPVTNKVNYKFECKTSKQFNVGLSIGDQAHAFFWNQSGEIRTTYKLSEQNSKTYSLIFQPPSTSTPISPGCVINIISNVSYPDSDVLREFASFIEISISDLVSLQGDVDGSVELPAKWAVLKSSPNRIATVVTTLSNELSAYQAELDQLNTDSLGAPEIAERKEILASLIESFSVDIDTLNALIKDIRDVTAIGTQCESTVPDTYCLPAVTSLTEKINKIVDNKIKVADDFNSFIDTEVVRLKTISITISNALKKIKVSTSAE